MQALHLSRHGDDAELGYLSIDDPTPILDRDLWLKQCLFFFRLFITRMRTRWRPFPVRLRSWRLPLALSPSYIRRYDPPTPAQLTMPRYTGLLALTVWEIV